VSISRGGLLLSGGALIVAGAIAAAVVMLGGPQAERERALDDRRAMDLEGLSTWTDYYYQQHKELPPTVEALARDRGGVTLSTRDPETGAPYEYRAIAGRQYELCATFARQSAEGRPLPVANFWAHPAGRQCFTLEAKSAR
jgi:hypothetical protein